MDQLVKHSLFTLGDIHGDWDIIPKLIVRLDLHDCDIIQVGDFGIGFRPLTKELQYLKSLDEILSDNNIKLYVIRGNHDDPKFFKDTYVFNNIQLIPDYTVLKLDAGNILCVGGAISIDRVYRTINGLGYWEDEVFSLQPHNIPDATNVAIDIVITHTAPSYCFPIGVNSCVKQFAIHDFTLLDELEVERERVDRLFELLKQHPIKQHVYGHFHTSYTEHLNNIKHILLNCNELYLIA